MHVGFAMARVTFMNAVAMSYPLRIVTAMATNWMPWASVEAIARPMRMAMAFATTRMFVSVRLTLATCAMAPGRFMPVDAPTSPRAIAIAMATKSTPLAFAGEAVMRT